MKSPNILLITTDQQRWDAIGYDNPAIKTPHLDKLASRGIKFSRAYCTHPVCTPSRCTILTGQYASKHGAYTIGCSLPEDYPTIPQHFGESGYFTGLVGKAHFQSCDTEGGFESRPNVFNTDFFRKWSGPYYGFEHAQLVIGHGTEEKVAGMHYGVWLEDQGVPVKQFFNQDFPYDSFGTWELPEEYHYSKWTADKTMDAIRKAEEDDKPFFIWSSFQDPHNPCYVPEPWDKLHDPETVPVYGYREGEMDDRAPFYQSIVDGRGFGDDPLLSGDKAWFCVSPCKNVDTEDKKRDIMSKYYGMMSLIDHHIGRLVEYLEKTGKMENTIIVFTSDHGEYMGNHGLWWKGLPSYEDAQKVPMFVVTPDCLTRGARSCAIQNLVDIGQTCLKLAGIPLPAGLQGVDQSGSWLDAHIKSRNNAVLEFRPTENDYMQKTFVTDRWKIVFYHEREHGELFDLDNDPEQYKNLWNCPEHTGVKLQLMQEFIWAEMEKDGTLIERTMWA